MDRSEMNDWLTAVSLVDKLEPIHTDGNPQFSFFHGNADDSEEDDMYMGNSQDASSDDEGSDEYNYDSNDSSDNHDYLRQRHPNYYSSQKGIPKQNLSATKEKQLPKWFIDRPLQYNTRVCSVALPGAVLLTLLGAEALVAILCLGCLVVYLFQTSGFSSRALTAYKVTYATVVIYTVYVCFPLLWKSAFNVTLLLAMGGYTTLTGAWILLSFQEFRKDEPELCHLIEFLLFTLFPLLAVVLVSWFISNLTSTMGGPYIIMAVGYPILQTFLQPTLSSFYKAPTGKPEDNYIVPTLYASFILVTFSIYPSLLHLFNAAFNGNLFQLYTGVELVFIFSSNVFMATVFDIGPLLLYYGYTEKQGVQARVGAIIIVIIAVPWVLSNHGFQSALLPWLPLVLFLHTGFGYTFYLNKNQGTILCFGVGLLVTYTTIFAFLPWSMNYYITGNMHISMIFALLYTNLVVTLECLIAYNIFSLDELGLSVITQTILVISTQKTLETGLLLSSSISICSSTAALYIFVKLYHWKKIAKEHVEVCVCLHMTAIFTGTFPIPGTTDVNVLRSTSVFSIMALFFLVLNKHLLFSLPCRELTVRQYGLHLLGVAVVSIINIPFWLPVIFPKVSGGVPNISDYIGCLLIILSVVSWKMSSNCHFKAAKYTSQSLLVLAVVMIVVQPSIHITWENALRWMAMMTLLQLLLINELSIYMKKSRVILLLLSLTSGIPIGLIVCEFVLMHENYLFNSICVVCVCVILVEISLCIWLESSQLEHQVFFRLGILVSAILVMMTVAFNSSGFQPLYICIILLVVVSLVMSSVLKLHSLRKHSLQLTKDGDVIVSKLPLIGNIFTLAAIIVSCILSPWELQYWIPASSFILILLQEDHIVLTSTFRGSHNLSPCLISATASFVVFTLCNSEMWVQSLWIPWFIGFVEIATVILTMPVLINFWTILWSSKFYLSDYYTVFAGPLYLILFLVGSSYLAYCLSITGLCAGMWLMKEKLPLIR